VVELGRAVASGEPVDPDDGDHDHALDARTLAGLVQVPCRGGEELGGRLLVG
jgi:hypothetical protein